MGLRGQRSAPLQARRLCLFFALVAQQRYARDAGLRGQVLKFLPESFARLLPRNRHEAAAVLERKACDTSAQILGNVGQDVGLARQQQAIASADDGVAVWD